MGLCTSILSVNCGLAISTPSISTLPLISGAVEGTAASAATTTSGTLTNATAGGLLLHTSAYSANRAGLITASSPAQYPYIYASQSMTISDHLDRTACAVNALQAISLVAFDSSVNYITVPLGSGTSISTRVSVTASGEAISAWTIDVCSASVHTYTLNGPFSTSTGVIQVKGASGLTSISVTTGMLDSTAAWSSKVLDGYFFSAADTTGIRMNITQSASALTLNGAEFNTGTEARHMAFLAKAKLYGTKFSADSNGYGIGAGSISSSTNSATAVTSHWSDAGVSASTSDYVSDVANSAFYSYSAYSAGIANAAITSAEAWDCQTSGTVIDLTNAPTYAQASAALTACGVVP